MITHQDPKGSTSIQTEGQRRLHPAACKCGGTGRWFTTKESGSAPGTEVVVTYGTCDGAR